MKLLVTILAFILLNSCVKQELTPQLPLDPQPIITDSTLINDDNPSLVGETWVITKIQYSDPAQPIEISDTLSFLNETLFTFNGDTSYYSLTLNSLNYKLSLYNTPWLETGNIQANLPNSFFSLGRIDGSDFYDIFNSTKKVRLWIVRS